ncbi:MAG: hypothetical protein V3W17_08985 [Desulfobacteria bacterium]
MARDRIALILESMAANKELKSSHYKVYLCIFSAQQEGRVHNESSLKNITGMHTRTVQKAIKEMLETGNIQKASDGSIYLNFTSGFPAIQKGESAAKGAVRPKTTSKTQSVLYQDTNNTEQETENIEHETHNEKHLNAKQDLRSSVPRNEELKGPDPRFKILVDTLFQVYEKEVGEKLNLMWTIADAAMIKRMLKALPEEKVDRIVSSFKSFLKTDDDFDAEHVRQSGVVRFWSSRYTQYLPEKEVDIKAIHAKMAGKKGSS